MKPAYGRSETRRAAMGRFLLALWGLATLVLLFCVVLLAYEMVRQGKDPLASLKKEPVAVPPAIQTGEPTAKKDVTLFFADAEGRRLVAETAAIDASDSTVENCRKALEGLIRGPRDILTPILPQSTKVRGLFLLEDGELVVDFSMELEVEFKKIKSASSEALMAYGVVNTLTQPALKGAAEGAVAKLRFLIEGATPRESFPAHLDVSKPLYPVPEWILSN